MIDNQNTKIKCQANTCCEENLSMIVLLFTACLGAAENSFIFFKNKKQFSSSKITLGKLLMKTMFENLF